LGAQRFLADQVNSIADAVKSLHLAVVDCDLESIFGLEDYVDEPSAIDFQVPDQKA
jgi:hypothetical protein